MALMSAHCLLAILVVILPLVVVAGSQGAPAPSPNNEQEWFSIVSPDSYSRKIEMFAVSEYNNESGKKLMLTSDFGGFQKVVPNGEILQLYIAATDSKSVVKYEVIVYNQSFPAGSKCRLLSFKQVEE